MNAVDFSARVLPNGRLQMGQFQLPFRNQVRSFVVFDQLICLRLESNVGKIIAVRIALTAEKAARLAIEVLAQTGAQLDFQILALKKEVIENGAKVMLTMTFPNQTAAFHKILSCFFPKNSYRIDSTTDREITIETLNPGSKSAQTLEINQILKKLNGRLRVPYDAHENGIRIEPLTSPDRTFDISEDGVFEKEKQLKNELPIVNALIGAEKVGL
ncbi:MAG: hypothetical protein JSS32_10665 [Verrucomicrobia bacterium]|nr:hypothetical protein [Verrucomicrobiota bacterium]